MYSLRHQSAYNFTRKMATVPIDDLATLEVLDETAILEELKRRYARDAIYVSTMSLIVFI